MSGEFLGRGVIGYAGVGRFTGRELQGLFLAEYDPTSDSYTAISFPQNEKFTQFFINLGKGEFAPETPINVGVALRITGYRHYPCDRPNYPFQFVLPGEDTAPLLAILTANAADHTITTQPPTPILEGDPNAGESSEQGNVELWEKLGYPSKAIWKNLGKPEIPYQGNN